MSSQTPLCPTTAAATAERPDRVVARWRGGEIRYGQLRAASPTVFDSLKRRHARELYQAEQQALDELLARQLISQAARASGRDYSQYLTELARVPDVDERAVRAYHLNHMASSGVRFEAVRAEIRAHLLRERRRDQLRREIARLKHNAALRVLLSAPRDVRIPLRYDSAPRRGRACAPIKIAAFLDFQSPVCAGVSRRLDALLKTLPKFVAVYFFHLPQDAHPGSMPAALAATCARRQGRFWQMHDALFNAQAQLESPGALRLSAVSAGLDLSRYDACFSSPGLRRALATAKRQSAAFGIEEAPTIFLNGLRQAGVPSLAAIVRNIAATAPAATAPAAACRRGACATPR